MPVELAVGMNPTAGGNVLDCFVAQVLAREKIKRPQCGVEVILPVGCVDVFTDRLCSGHDVAETLPAYFQELRIALREHTRNAGSAPQGTHFPEEVAALNLAFVDGQAVCLVTFEDGRHIL